MGRVLAGRSVYRAASDLGMSQSTLHKYVTRERFPGTSAIDKLAQAAGVAPWEVLEAVEKAKLQDELRAAEKTAENAANFVASLRKVGRQAAAVFAPPAGYVSIPLLDVPVSAGHGAAVQSHPAVLRHVDVLGSWATTRLGSDLSKVRLVTVRGDSMQPTLSAGDVLFVDSEQREYSTEGLYVLSRGGDVFVKRLQMRSRGALAVISDNPVYPVELLEGADLGDVVICGRVLASWALRQLS